MPDVDAVLRAADALVGEAQRRSRGEDPDRRFDLPLAVILDLDETLGPERSSPLRLVPKAAVASAVGGAWCVEHRRFDFCGGDAAA